MTTNTRMGHCGFFAIPIADRFWSKADIGDGNVCWDWHSTIREGYGSIKIGDKKFSSHRIAYQLTYGEIPAGLCVCHKCDNRKCINPNHLFVGTRGDNNRDRHLKGRSNFIKGESSVLAKLKNRDIDQIRKLYSTKKYKQYFLAAKFGVDQGYISKIVNNIVRLGG